MLNEEQKQQIGSRVQDFKGKVSQYVQKKSELKKIGDTIEIKQGELSKVAKEERQMEAAINVLYGQSTEESRAARIEEEIEHLQREFEMSRNELTQLKTSLIEGMQSFPIPADLENPGQDKSDTIFPYFEGSELGEEVIDTMCDLFRQKPPLNFNEVEILPDKITVKNALGKQDAIQKMVEAIQMFRMQIDSIAKSYEKVDEMVERLVKSKLYYGILKALFERGRLSTNDIASILNIDKRRAYDGCYNLTRTNWSPHPIQPTASKEWELTLAGEIVINRVFEKYPEKASDTEDVR